MLKHLEIIDFAIIDKIELDFNDGLTVITGETGAGKSILVDAISLLLGDRASQDMIRSGSDKASIRGVFVIGNPDLRQSLYRMNIEMMEDQIEILRELSSQNRNTIRINNQPITLQQLKELAVNLADIHSQFDTQKLLNPQNYLEMIDGFRQERINVFKLSYQSELEKLQEMVAKLRQIKVRRESYLAKQEMYAFQLAELERFNLDKDEVERLSGELEILKNFDRIYEQLHLIDSEYADTGVTDALYRMMKTYEKLGAYSEKYMSVAERIAEHYYDLKEIETETRDAIAELNFDPMRLDEIQKRLYDLEKLETKYGRSIPSLVDYRDELLELQSESDDFETLIEKQEVAVKSQLAIVKAEALSLSNARQEIAAIITRELVSTLKDLSLAHTEFDIHFRIPDASKLDEPSTYGIQGIDEIEFFISTNLGEPLKPLSRAASGGEMSRIMLALKTIFVRSQQLETIVFDEIDTGISGRIAKQIAKKLKSISKDCQVLSITHIPQVVAMGEHHLRVSKADDNNRTSASARYLDFDGRINEIAQMISGEKPSEANIRSARELLLEN
ncbi:MAG: DNA repair protein RecN [Bacilli bacterium]|nr:DNA repair protein RecN [Bacilli bacterium]